MSNWLVYYYWFVYYDWCRSSIIAARFHTAGRTDNNSIIAIATIATISSIVVNYYFFGPAVSSESSIVNNNFLVSAITCSEASAVTSVIYDDFLSATEHYII